MHVFRRKQGNLHPNGCCQVTGPQAACQNYTFTLNSALIGSDADDAVAFSQDLLDGDVFADLGSKAMGQFGESYSCVPRIDVSVVREKESAQDAFMAGQWPDFLVAGFSQPLSPYPLLARDVLRIKDLIDTTGCARNAQGSRSPERDVNA